MTEMQTLKGCKSTWIIKNKIGEGDAGEVFLVESETDNLPAILKRPYLTVDTPSIYRQSEQIEKEALILNYLNGINLDKGSYKVCSPKLIDVSVRGSEKSRDYFIVIEKAKGIDLGNLIRIVLKSDNNSLRNVNQSIEEFQFLQEIRKTGAIPELILLRCIDGILSCFEKIHTNLPGLSEHLRGIVWNDIKPDHIFWDPHEKSIWVIDWGNSYFLDTTWKEEDILQALSVDYEQFIGEFKKLLELAYPKLFAEIPWGHVSSTWESINTRRDILSKSYIKFLEEKESQLRNLNRQVGDLISLSDPSVDDLNHFEYLRTAIYQSGEIPDPSLYEQFLNRSIRRLIHTHNYSLSRSICEKALMLNSGIQKWTILHQYLSQINEYQQKHNPDPEKITSLILDEDYYQTLWDICATCLYRPLTYQEEDLIHTIRDLILGIDNSPPVPWILLNRLYHTLQSNYLSNNRIIPTDPVSSSSGPNDKIVSEKLIISLREISQKWKEVEPDPPGAGISYNSIDQVLGEIEYFAPDQVAAFRKSLIQPNAQVEILLSAWEQQKFDLAIKVLKKILVWDPDRVRVIAIEKLLREANSWIKKVHHGPKKSEKLIDFISQTEITGRDFLTRIAPATWLEKILKTFTNLRKGLTTRKVILEIPDITNDMPWLVNYDTVEDISALSIKLADLSPKSKGNISLFKPIGKETILFPDDYQIISVLDNWIPEARGSSARVFGILSSRSSLDSPQAVIKIMRPGEEKYALPLFEEEVQILPLLESVPGVVKLMEFGFIQIKNLEILSEDHSAILNNISASAWSFSVDQQKSFLKNLDIQTAKGWLPFLILEYKPSAANLMNLTDAGQTRGQLFSIKKGIVAAVQACEILEAAHRNNIVYRDHKILHYYWEDHINKTTIIDWNVARWHPEGLRQEEIEFDLVQFGARALHHIFTGRPAPGALPLGPNRPAEIDAAQHSYQPQWTYDDLRLPEELKILLTQVLSGSYHSARQLRTDLTRCYLNYNPQE